MENKNFKFSYIIFIIIFITLFIIVIHPARREFTKYLYEIHKWKQKVAKITKENIEYQKRLLYLQTKPELMDKLIKSELGEPGIGYVAEDEIVYVFKDSEKEDLQQ